MTAITATARYELLMQVRKASMWISAALVVGLMVLVSKSQIGKLLMDPDPRSAMVVAAIFTNLFMVLAYGCLLADRLVRDDRLGVAQVLDVTPTRPAARLVGKYLGVAAAGSMPVVVVYFGFAIAYAVLRSEVAALGWAVLVFAAVLLPALLFVAAFALACPMFMPAPLFRVLFIGYWFWGNAISPELMPTLSRTLIHPVGGYPIEAFFHFRASDGLGTWAGPVPGATLNFLRPQPTPATAWVSIALLVLLAGVALASAYLRRVRGTR
jgi:ABC-2 type transport system permease protein